MEALARAARCSRDHPLALAWPVAGAALGLVAYAEPATTRVLVALTVALPGLLRIVHALGADGTPSLPQPIPSEPPTLARRLRAWVGRTPSGPQADPLRKPVAAIGVTLVVLATAIVALILSIAAGAPHRLPAVALSSPALFHVQRMLVPTFFVALLSVFLIRAAFGYFPLKVSTTSAEWPAGTATEIADAGRTLTKVVRDVDADQRQLVDDLSVHSADIARLGEAAAGQSRAIVVLRRIIAEAVPNGDALFEREWERLERELSQD